MSDLSVRPEDILTDSENTAQIQGVTIRKGSAAAFLRNIDLLENPASSAQEKAEILNTLRTLAPAIVAVGLHKHATFKNITIQKILDEAATA